MCSLNELNVSGQILKFRNFLLDSWEDLDSLMETHDWEDDGRFTDDWLQVNWEFLVERQLLKGKGFLNSYGIYHAKARVTEPQAEMTHEIVCKSKDAKSLIDVRTGEIIPRIELIFSCFLTRVDNSFGLYPPFDYAVLVSIDRKQRFHVHVDQLEFFLHRINDRRIVKRAK